MKKNGCFATSIALAVLLAAPAGAAPFISTFHRIHTVSSTVPHNGDVNPYGVAVVPRSVGLLHAGDILVSNFNNSQNLQGTGTTIVQIPRTADSAPSWSSMRVPFPDPVLAASG